MKKSQAKNAIRPKRSGVSRYTSVSRQSPISMRLRTTLTYSEIISHSALTFRDYQFRLNSLFDPNFTGAGHQPLGFDQLKTLYGRYRVISTRWKISLTTISGSQANPTILVVVPTNDVAGYGDLTNAIEAYRSDWITTTQNVPHLNFIEGQIDLALLNGKTHQAYMADDTTQAITTTDPIETLQLHVCVGSSDGSTNVGCYTVVQLWFDVEFSDPVELGQS